MICPKNCSKKPIQSRFSVRILAEYCAKLTSTLKQQIYMSVESLTNLTCTGTYFVQLGESVRRFVQLLEIFKTIVSTSNQKAVQDSRAVQL